MTAALVASVTERTGEDRRIVERVALAVLFALVFALALRPALDNDLWWHLRTADWMLDHHRWVGVDPFTHTRPGVARVQTDWIAQLVLFGTWRVGGLAAVSVLMASLATLGTALIHLTTTGRFGIRVATTALVAAASSVFWVSRPQMFTFVFTAAVVWTLRRWRASSRLWWLVPLFALWANVHGGVVYGLVLLLAVAGGEVLEAVAHRSVLPRRLLAVVLACVTVVSLNPSGVRIYGLPFHQVASSARYVSEVQAPTLRDPWVWPFFLLLAVTALLVARSWRSLRWPEVLPIVAGAALALRFTRGIPFFATVAAPVVAAQASAWWSTRRRPPVEVGAVDRRRLLAAAGLVVAAVLVTTPFRVTGDRVDHLEAAAFPVGATAWLNANEPPTELFNSFDWGGYLMLFAPAYRVAIDGRTDVYDEYLDTYVDVVEARPGWEAELDREGVNVVLLQVGTPLVAVLDGDQDWVLRYEDDVAVVYARRDTIAA